MSYNRRRGGYKGFGTKDRSAIILVTLLIGLCGLYYGCVWNESHGVAGEQWTPYNSEYTVTLTEVYEPYEVRWVDGSEIDGMVLTMTSDYVEGASSVTATVKLSGFLYDADTLIGSFIISDEAGTNTDTQNVTITVEENSGNLIVLVVSVISLCAAVYFIVRAR